MTSEGFQTSVAGGFGAIASAFVIDSLSHMIPWLLTMFFVVLTDLAFGVRRCWLMGEEVRFSKGVRATMTKMTCYFAFVVSACMVQTASQSATKIDKWACLLVCFIEGCSIVNNILRPKGYSLNFVGVMKVIGNKTGFGKLEEIFKKDNKQKK